MLKSVGIAISILISVLMPQVNYAASVFEAKSFSDIFHIGGPTEEICPEFNLTLKELTNALVSARDEGDRHLEAILLNQIGATLCRQYDFEQAVQTYLELLDVLIALEQPQKIQETLLRVARIELDREQYSAIKKYFEEYLLQAEQKEDDRLYDAVIGALKLFFWASDYNLSYKAISAKGLESWQEAIDILELIYFIEQKTKGLPGLLTLERLGVSNYYLGNYDAALLFYQEAFDVSLNDESSIPIFHENKVQFRAMQLNHMALVYKTLGQYEAAQNLLNQALHISGATCTDSNCVSEMRSVAYSLGYIGIVLAESNRCEEALKYLEVAERSRGTLQQDSWWEPAYEIMNGFSKAYICLQDYESAVHWLEKVLNIDQLIDQRAFFLYQLGVLKSYMSEYEESVEIHQQALQVHRQYKSKEGEATSLASIADALKALNSNELAIIFYKQSINVYEDIRDRNQLLTQEQQESYTDTVADTYRKLADLLLQENRVLEAQAVLDLLRTQELEDYFQDVRSSSTTTNDLNYWQLEEDIIDLYTRTLSVNNEIARIIDIPYNDRTPEDSALLAEFGDAESELIKNFNDFVNHPLVKDAVTKLRNETDGQNIELTSLRTLQDSIANLPNTVLLYPLIFEDRLELILIPPNSPPIRRPVAVKSDDLNKAILDYRNVLRDPTQDAKSAAQKLYNYLIADIENDLALLDTKTIVYSPDGALRYIPLAALYDGTQWLAERFSISHITVESVSSLDTPPQTDQRILAAACAECSFSPTVGDNQYQFSDLPFTLTEVNAITEQISTVDTLINREFSRKVTEDRLKEKGRYNIIHLATHGVFVSGQPDDSFLLFGDDTVVTLREIENWDLTGIDLVVLSACQTGLGGIDLGNGIEVLGLGYQLQRAKAKAAIASLWRVDDGGTQALMNAFYLALSEGFPKAEALRRAQLALIQDDLSVIAGEPRAAIDIVNSETGEPIRLSASADHPYYWAPFILIGNGL